MNKLTHKKLFLLDMDGTIYLDNELFDGTLDFLDYVKAIGGRYIFLTNNSSKGVDKYIEKLASMGIEATADDFMTSVNATIEYMKPRAYRKIYVSGTASFARQLSDAGLCVTQKLEDDIDCLCMGNDTELTFQKLEDSCILLGRGVDYIATNPDWVCPTWYGFVPDCGCVCEMLGRATGRSPKFIGKPEPDMVYLACKKTGFSPDEAIIFGDRLYTDIKAGLNAGISTVFVLSGEATLDDLAKSEDKPEYVFKDIKEFYLKLRELREE